MNVDALLKTTLEGLGYPVERLKYDGKAKTYITYQLVVGRDVHYIALMRSAKRALKEAGFYGITFDPEVFEENTGYYHVPVEIKYMEV